MSQASRRTALGKFSSFAFLFGCAVSLTAACGDDADSGGASATGGTTAASGTGGSSGGALAPTGGVKASGGSSGGTPATTGGNKATGGTPAAGGASATGGTPATGGATTTGGTTTTGGVTASGGSTATAGAGGKANGGSGGATGGAPAGTGGTGGTHSGPWRIMPLGDSITETTCQTQLLWKKLRDNDYTNFDLVGSKKNNQACGVTSPDQDCEGHGGYKTLQIVSGGKATAELSAWVTSGKADIVLMHFGTNDVWNSAAIDPQPLIDAFGVIVDTFRASNPSVIFFVAQIIPLNPTQACAACNANATALNDAIPGFATAKTTAASPIYVVNQNAGFTSSSDTGDGVHPNVGGSQKMADKWYAALLEHGIF